jgi:hypothetical protein
MNEELPPPYDPERPEPPSILPPGTPEPPSFWGMFGLGTLLIILSCLLCAAFGNPLPLGMGAFVAIGSLFFNGRRGIFIGFVSTIGVCLLIAAIACGAMVARH